MFDSRWIKPATRCVAALLPVFTFWGCATNQQAEVHQFAPLPTVHVGERELRPVSTRPVSDLLRDAEAAFHAANEAQEAGDGEEAKRQYQLMQELMIEAELDPRIFYNSREEFAHIIDGSVERSGRHSPQRHYHAGHSHHLRPSGEFNEIQIPFPLPERILVELDEILHRYPKGFQIGLDRSFKYVPYITQEFEKAGLPTELAWICMVESQFTPKIVSHAGAGGMWQFMRVTGRRYNLRIDSYVDERYDWKASTHAAIRMFKDLHDFFDGDWALAIAAYNMGEGGLERAINANGGMRDFWTLVETPPASNRIKRETKKYYPRFLASLIVASNPTRYGFEINPQPAEDTVRIPVQGFYALGDLDKAMGVPNGTLARYNPDLIQEMTPPTGQYPVTVPTEKREQFLAALSKAKKMQMMAATYTVKRGDTISKIASRYRVSQTELMRVNHIKSARSLAVGKVLRIPGRHTASGGGASAPAPTGNRVASTYKVRRGDTLIAIAQRHGVSVESLQDWNSMGRRTNLNVGQTLKVYGKGSGGSSASGGSNSSVAYGTHTVHAGEYPAKIARAYGMSLSEFLSANNMSKDATIRVGQKVKVRGGAVGGSAPAATSTYKVKPGDTASTIARNHGVSTGDLLAMNGLSAKSILRVGQSLKVNGSATPQVSAKKHVVAKGHNPTTIARRYGVNVNDLYKWNDWSRNHILHIGDEVLIYD